MTEERDRTWRDGKALYVAWALAVCLAAVAGGYTAATMTDRELTDGPPDSIQAANEFGNVANERSSLRLPTDLSNGDWLSRVVTPPTAGVVGASSVPPLWWSLVPPATPLETAVGDHGR